ncbi:PH domain-containing protein [Patescibacteria group bacterium]
MFQKYLLKSIGYDEAVIRIFRSSLVHYRWSLLGYSGLVIASFFFLYPLQSFGRWGWLIFLILIIIALLGLIKTFLVWSLNVFILTNRRIIDIDRRKFFEKHVAECPLENIQDIRYNQRGVIATLFKIGSVIIDSGSAKGHIEMPDVPEPEAVKELIMRERRHHGKDEDETQEI